MRCATWWLVGAFLGACHRAPDGRACGAELSASELWSERSEQALAAEITRANACAQRTGKRVLLEFIAPWCDDCRAMTALEQTPTVAAVLRERYERVRVNVGRWDEHTALRMRYGITRIAAYVVLDPATGARLAQTTMEPVTGARNEHGALTPEAWAAWLRSPR